MTTKEIKRQIADILNERGYVEKVWAKIYGHRCKINEAEFRALAVMAIMKALESDEAFNEFACNVVIYDSCSGKEIRFLKDGHTDRKFDCAFLRAKGELHLCTIKARRVLKIFEKVE